tara:strand:- start:73 stop:282 length:210 start_codon:yes stop_codon:yes gene_type:complete
MSENTEITEKRLPNPQKIKWSNVAYYDSFQQADEHRKNLDGLTKVRRCGPFKSKFVVKSGTPVKGSSDE